MSFLQSRRFLPLQIALWVLPLAGIVLWARNQQAPTLPDSTGGFLELLAALAVYVVATLLRSERWHAILVAEEIPAKRADTYALVPIGYMGNNALPARSGELLRVFLLGRRVDGQRRAILGTILVERLLDAVALGGLLVVLAWSLASQLTMPGTPVLVAGGAVLLVALLVAGYFMHRAHLRERAIAALKPLLSPLRHLGTVRGLALLIGSVAIWVLEALVYQLTGEAVGIHLGLHGALSVVAFTNLCALVPAAPGYIGTYDAAVLFAVKAVGNVSGRLALSYLLLLRFVLFVPITLVGLGLLFARYGGLRGLRAARVGVPA